MNTSTKPPAIASRPDRGLPAVLTALTALSWALRPPGRRIHRVSGP